MAVVVHSTGKDTNGVILDWRLVNYEELMSTHFPSSQQCAEEISSA